LSLTVKKSSGENLVEGIAWDREQVPASEPKTKTKLSLPRCIYGMETQTYSKSDMET